MARPTKLTANLTREITSYIQNGNTPTVSATLVGISPSTYFDWMIKGAISSRGFWSFRSQLSVRVHNQLSIGWRISPEWQIAATGALLPGC